MWDEAKAAWQKASTKHFVIYGDMPAEELRDYEMMRAKLRGFIDMIAGCIDEIADILAITALSKTIG